MRALRKEKKVRTDKSRSDRRVCERKKKKKQHFNARVLADEERARVVSECWGIRARQQTGQ